MWNIYAAQASDGDNWADDSPLCHEIDVQSTGRAWYEGKQTGRNRCMFIDEQNVINRV
ncbi:DUF444 family protein [Escherichia coli]|uniref:DUF444 family protein n=1 Tax=Escherichia coli TaxID=562 RepID=UPI001CC4B071|nr:DUF444 family protein [Escherichia coli]